MCYFIGNVIMINIIKLTATLLGLNDVISYIDNLKSEELDSLNQSNQTLATSLPSNDEDILITNDAGQESQPSVVENKISQLITFANYVLREITKEYFPLRTLETLKSDEDGLIYFSDLSKKVASISNVKNCLGFKVNFMVYPEYIKLERPNSEYIVYYNYYLEPANSLNSALTLPLGLDYYVVSYKLASEYALANLLYSEAELWESKFRKALENINSRGRERRFTSQILK